MIDAFGQNTGLYSGYKIQISSPYPRVQCSGEFARIQAPELVRDTNAWLAARYGFKSLIPDGVVRQLNSDTLVMTEKTLQQLRAALAQR